MGIGEDWGHLLCGSPSSFTPVAPGTMASPRALALLATTEWMSKGKDLWDHPGPRWLGPERWLSCCRRCRAEGLGPFEEGLETFLQGRALRAPPASQPRISPGGEKQVTEAAVLGGLRPAGGSRSAPKGEPTVAPLCTSGP